MKLDIIPYNGNWMNCVLNNLFATLLIRNQSYERYTGITTSYYETNIPLIDVMDKDGYHFYQTEGWGIMTVRNFLKESIDNKFFERSISQVNKHPSTETEILTMIKDFILQGYYVFTQVNRFFFKNSTDYMKHHTIHPTFIYGFDDNLGRLYLIEDCVETGKFDYYELSYSDFFLSIELLIKKEKEPYTVNAFRPKIKSDIDNYLPLNNIIQNLEINLISKKKLLDNTHIVYGLDAIGAFFEQFYEMLPMNQNRPLLNLHISSTVQYQLRNVELIELLYSFKILNQLEYLSIKEELSVLLDQWTLFRNKVYYFFLSNRYSNISDAFPDLSGYKELENIERRVLEKLISKLYARSL